MGTLVEKIKFPLISVGLFYGFLAGVIAALMYSVMHYGQELLWHAFPSRWAIFPIVVIAGVIIFALSRFMDDLSIDDQLQQGADVKSIHRKRTLALGTSATIAVIAGGAIGPEAGLLAVVTELSALIAYRMRNAQIRAAIGEIGNAAVLGALYGSPPAGVAYPDDAISKHRIFNIIAASAGFLGFLVVVRATHASETKLPFAIAEEPSWRMLFIAVAAAIAGLVCAILFCWLDFYTVKATASLPKQVTIVGGSVVIAALFTAMPELRFSGQVALHDLAVGYHSFTPSSLVWLALLKVVAVILCVHSGWKGGVLFPLLFVGACLGVAVALLLPGSLAGVGAIAAISACLTGVLRKPLVVILIVAFLLPGFAYIPLLTGVAIGSISAYLAPKPAGH